MTTEKTTGREASSPKSETIKRIIASARHEFSITGLAGTRMDTVAHAANVTKQLLYLYFGSKNALFAAVLNEQADCIISELMKLDLTTPAPQDALRLFLTCVFDQYLINTDLMNLAQEAIAYHNVTPTTTTKFPEIAPELVEKIDNLLQRGIQSGVFKKNLQSRYFLATAILIMTGGFTNSYMLSNILGFDHSSPSGALQWRDYALNFALSAVLTNPSDTKK